MTAILSRYLCVKMMRDKNDAAYRGHHDACQSHGDADAGVGNGPVPGVNLRDKQGPEWLVLARLWYCVPYMSYNGENSLNSLPDYSPEPLLLTKIS